MQSTGQWPNTGLGFLSINNLVPHQGELAITLDFNSSNQQGTIEACAQLSANTTQKDIAAAYISLCDAEAPIFNDYLTPHTPQRSDRLPDTVQQSTRNIAFANARAPAAIFAGKKYKPIALKIRPIEMELPSQFQIIHEIKGDPLQDLPILPTRLANFVPTGWYMAE